MRTPIRSPLVVAPSVSSRTFVPDSLAVWAETWPPVQVLYAPSGFENSA